MFVQAICCLGVVVSALASPPAEWVGRINSWNAFYAEDDTGKLEVNGYPGIYLPLVGNGYISQAQGVRGDTMFISGIFNGETTSPSHRAAIPSTFAVTVDDSKTTGVLLDIRAGTYHRRGQLNGSNSWYELVWYAHRSVRSLFVLELTVHVDPSESHVNLSFSSTNSTSTDFHTDCDQTFANGDRLYCGTTTIPETAGGPTHNVCVASNSLPSTLVVKAADSGKTMTYVSAFRTSLDSESVASSAVADLQLSRQLSDAGELFSQHVDGWKELWKSGIEISGRPDVGVAVNASLYAIHSSVRADWPYGLAPGGLTNYYNGHSFWDTETWMYPPLLYLHPEIAHSLIDYRFNRLEGARIKAASYDPPFSGTMFPWESAFSGVETCPTFAATGLREDHISGDISFAVWQLWLMGGHRNWLKSVGYPILTGVADFVVSIAERTKESDGTMTAHINDIIPPDEYVDHVNDSVYTNFGAAQALRFAVAAAEELGVLDQCAECPLYKTLSDELVILFDNVTGTHPEYAGYPGNLVKQGDVVLLHYPLGMEMSSEIQRNDLEYYSERTDVHGPAMTWGMHAIGFLDLLDFAQASKYFNMSFQDNMHAPLQVWTETPDGNAVNFITGAGGFLQTMIAGYPGIRLDSESGELSITPTCPEGADHVRMRSLQYQGSSLDFEYWCDEVYHSSPSSAKNMKSSGGLASKMRIMVVNSGKRGAKNLSLFGGINDDKKNSSSKKSKQNRALLTKLEIQQPHTVEIDISSRQSTTFFLTAN